MLSYQHAYHAGNHADVLKHWLLLECVQYLQKKDAPFEYIDTHAGNGLYSLTSATALKTAEFKAGIEKLWQQPIPALQHYVRAVNPYLKNRQYPGSPTLVNNHLRSQDKSWLFELHPQAFEELQRNCARGRQTFVKKENGYDGLKAIMPVRSKRALVLIDPSYEVKTEFDTVVKAVKSAHQRMPNATYLIWYPVVERRRVQRFEQQWMNSGIRNVMLFEIGVRADNSGGMTASGMIIVNPPWSLAALAEQVLPELSQTLSEDGQARARCRQLVPE